MVIPRSNHVQIANPENLAYHDVSNPAIFVVPPSKYQGSAPSPGVIVQIAIFVRPKDFMNP
jgi:hypothetical protein